MDETSTKNLFVITNENLVKGDSNPENLTADEMMFFHSLRTDMSKLELSPRPQVIHQILDYSRNFR